MKKIVLGSLIAASCLIGTAVSADQGSEIHLGYNHVSVDNSNNTTGNEGLFGWNYAIPLTVLGNGDTTGMEVGFGWDIGVGSMSGDTSESNGFSSFDAKIFIGYQYHGLHIRGGGGYGFLKISSNNNSYTGAEYITSLGYNFTKKYGVEVAYKGSTMSQSGSPDVDFSNIGVNFIINWN